MKNIDIKYFVKLSFILIPILVLFILLLITSLTVNYEENNIEEIELRKECIYNATTDSLIKAAELYEEGKRFVFDRKYEDAELKFKRALECYPDYTEVHRDLQDLWYKQNKYLTVESIYKEYLAKNPDKAVYNYLYGRTLNDNEEALKYYQKAIHLDTDYFWSYYAVFWELLEKNKLKEARKYLSRAKQCKYVPSQIYFAYGLLYEKDEKSQKAVAMYNKFLSEENYYDADGTFRARLRKLANPISTFLLYSILALIPAVIWMRYLFYVEDNFNPLSIKSLIIAFTLGAVVSVFIAGRAELYFYGSSRN